MSDVRRITTVTGDISVSELGFCQCHEHIMLRSGVPATLNPALRADDVGKSSLEVAQYIQCGGTSLVDAQPIGCGRMPEELKRISENTGAILIASTGFHLRRFYPTQHWIHTISETRLEGLFVHELTVGLYENADRTLTGSVLPIRAGIIKTACEGEPLSQDSRRLFAAAARAALQCGTSVMIHTEKGCNPLEVLDYLCGCGVPPQRLIFCHLDRTLPNQYITAQLCKEGAYIEYDTIGRLKYHSDSEEIRFILELLEQGFDRQLLLSLDTTNQRMRSYGGEIGLDYLLKIFLPMLESAGVAREVLHTIMRENPACALGCPLHVKRGASIL
ncbi:phosphotriesterase family protein [Lawsonibacter sp. LCP25S3_G6]